MDTASEVAVVSSGSRRGSSGDGVWPVERAHARASTHTRTYTWRWSVPSHAVSVCCFKAKQGDMPKHARLGLRLRQ